MKTNRFFACMMMAAAVCACQKETATPQEAGDKFFTACIEQPVAETKASLENGVNVSFTVNDKIRVTENTFTNKKDCKCTKGGASGAEFTFNTGLNAEADAYYAIYPYNATRPEGFEYGQVNNLSVGGTGYEYKAESNIFPTQIAVLDGVDPNSFGMAGKAGKDKVFRFSQMSSLVKFELKREGVAKVVLTALNGSAKIAGRYNVQCQDEDSDGWFDKFTQGTNTGDESEIITLLPPSGNDTFPQGVYHIATRPGRNCASGLSLTFYDAADTEMKTFSKTDKVQLNRGKIRFLGSFTW